MPSMRIGHNDEHIHVQVDGSDSSAGMNFMMVMKTEQAKAIAESFLANIGHVTGKRYAVIELEGEPDAN